MLRKQYVSPAQAPPLRLWQSDSISENSLIGLASRSTSSQLCGLE